MKKETVLKVVHYTAIALGAVTLIATAFGAGFKDFGDLENYYIMDQVLRIVMIVDVIFYIPYFIMFNKKLKF